MRKRYSEYGLYIRRASKTNDYVVGFYGAGPIAHFPTYEDAEDALEDAIERAWELHSDDFYDTIIEALIT